MTQKCMALNVQDPWLRSSISPHMGCDSFSIPQPHHKLYNKNKINKAKCHHECLNNSITSMHRKESNRLFKSEEDWTSWLKQEETAGNLMHLDAF